MARLVRFVSLGVLVAVVCPMTLRAQFPSGVVGFNGPPIDDPATSQEMVQQPQFSGSTSSYIVPNTPGAYDWNAAFRAAGLQTEGDAALEAFFYWTDTDDADSWVRLTTYNGPERPNPSLDTRGKVRFKITNRSELFDGEIGICLGIRETGGVDIPQLADGGTSGPIEWVGVDTTVNGIIAGPDMIVDTQATGDDVQVYPVGYDLVNDPNEPLPTGTAVISPGTNGTIDTVPIPDDEYRFGYFIAANGNRRPIPAITLPPVPTPYQLEWNLATGAVSLNGSPQGGGIAGFTGNGTLADCPDDRGTLEHITITNLESDVAVLINFAIDELQFEATVPDPTPPPRIRGPVVETDTIVEVECVLDATDAELFINEASQGHETPVDGLATFNELELTIGDVLTAKQTANGVESDFSAPVVVYAEGTALAEGFDGYASQEELEALWTQDDPTNDRKILLTSGSASSCENFVFSDYDPGSSVSRLYFPLPAINGSDAQPLLLTYRFKHDYNDTEARARFELTSSLTRVYGAVGFAFTNGVGGLWGEQYTTMTNNPVPVEGYEYDYFYYDYALTGIEREPGVWHKMQIEVLSTVFNFYIDDQLANPLDPDTGLPIWPGGVPRGDYTDDFEYVIIGVGFSNNGPAMMYDDISITLGDTEIPFGDPHPIESPTVDGPLFPDGTEVEVSDIDPDNATAVAVYVNATEVASAAGPFPEGTASITVPTLYDGQTVTATQTVDSIESCYSWPVVVAVPAPTVDPILIVEDVTVEVSDIEENLASAVTVYEDREGDMFVLGSVSNPATDPVDVSVPALEAGMVIVATQTIGGVESPFSEGVTVESEPPAIVEWIQTSSLPFGLTDHYLVYLNGYIYSTGGRTGSGTDPSCQATSYVFYAPVNSDGSIGAWQETTSLPEERACHGAAAYDGRIYVWGGWTVGWPTRNTCWYAEPNPDGTLGAWQVSAITIPDGSGQIQMDAFGRGDLIYDNTLYIINGERNNATNSRDCYYSTLTPEGDYSPWILTNQTDNPSWFHGVAVIEGTTDTFMYRVAGNFRGTTEYTMIRSTIQPDRSLSEWTHPDDLPHVPEARYEHACVSADNKWIFVICGLYSADPQNSVFYTAIDPDTGELLGWRIGPDYPETVSRNCGVTYSVGGRTYILVAGGGPYSGVVGNRTPRCYYAVITSEEEGIPGDVDGDGDVDLADLAALLGAYGTSVGDPDYNPDADIDEDGDVDLSDLAELLGHYGEGT
ncbi:MAG: hypothetical protein KKI02_06255 [Planctomycetes bacterium]|nr:hypothetical protein [Planctomycetota bacterium]